MLLLVDEAHGAHLQFSKILPPSAMDSGADLSAQSTHKLLGSLTQTSMLMIRKKFIDVERVRKVSSILQTTSPNYLLLASLDISRLQMQETGEEKIFRAIELSKKIRRAVEQIPNLKTFDAVKNFSLDLLKVTINVENLGLNGLEAEKILRHESKIQCELSDPTNLLFLVTYADTEEKILRLIEVLEKFAEKFKNNSLVKKISQINFSSEISEPKISPREIFFAQTESVSLEKSVGRICAEEVTFYPPGIPSINPGEKITAEFLENIRQLKNIGGRIIGASDTNLNSVRIKK